MILRASVVAAVASVPGSLQPATAGPICQEVSNVQPALLSEKSSATSVPPVPVIGVCTQPVGLVQLSVVHGLLSSQDLGVCVTVPVVVHVSSVHTFPSSTPGSGV